MSQSDPRRDAAFRIVEISRLLRSVVEQRLKPHGMTRAQFAALSRLERQDGLAQHVVAESLEIQPIVMVRLVDQLSAEGLIERRPDPDDRRCNRLFLTAGGRKRLRDLADLKLEIGHAVFAGIGQEDLRQMLATLGKVHANLKSIQSADAQAARLRKFGT
jgi:MarR family transcriptional regulator, transcriptional regulator for hemolysin